jgi:hypothetical protein
MTPIPTSTQTQPPPAPPSPLASMVRDLLAGNLAMGPAILEELADAGRMVTEFERRDQWFQLNRALKRLVAGMVRCEEFITLPGKRRAAIQVEWESFCREVRAVFAWELWGQGAGRGAVEWAGGVVAGVISREGC